MVYLYYGIHISVDLAQYEIFRAKVCCIWQGWYKREGRHKINDRIISPESVSLHLYTIFALFWWTGMADVIFRTTYSNFLQASNLSFQNEVCILSIEILDSNMPILLFLTRLLI